MARPFTIEEIKQIALVRDLFQSGDARKIRESGRVKRSEAAGRVPCHASAILRWEEGRRTPRPDVALRLAEVYGEFATMAASHKEAK